MNLRNNLLIIILSLWLLPTLYAQSSFEPFLVSSLPIMSSIEADGWKIIEIKTGHIKGKTKVDKVLREGRTYGFYACGDKRIAEIKASVLRIAGDKTKVFQTEEESGKDATIIFEVKKTGLYRFLIEVEDYSSNNSQGFYNMIFFKK